eukprot:5080926-Pyramimonas_sp.AAC.2
MTQCEGLRIHLHAQIKIGIEEFLKHGGCPMGHPYFLSRLSQGFVELILAFVNPLSKMQYT